MAQTTSKNKIKLRQANDIFTDVSSLQSNVSSLQSNVSSLQNGHNIKPIMSGCIGNAIATAQFTGSGRIPFNEFWVQRGITYNSGNRTFTVSQSGIYRVTLNTFKNGASGAFEVIIGKNTLTPTRGTSYGVVYDSTSGYNSHPLNSIIPMNANDYICFYLVSGQGYNENDKFWTFAIEYISSLTS